MNNFFQDSLLVADNEINNLINKEKKRQQHNIELIASENIVSKAVLDAQGSILTNKYAEGYPHKRYYGGCEYVDLIEEIAINRVKELFDCKYANVQPHSGSQANMAVYLALLEANDTILGMDLLAGGHLTHGAKVSFSGKIFNSVSYGVNKDNYLIDYNEVEEVALKHKPKLIIAGGSAYSRVIDFKKFREIANKVGAFLLVDMAHFAGLVAAKQHPSPFEFADVVTSTTHKTLRGARGGLILSNSLEIMKKVNSAIFPGSQGGPLLHVIAGKAVAFKEALQPYYKEYIKQVMINAKVMADEFIKNGYDVLTGGTDTHLFLVNVNKNNLNGKLVEKCLDKVNITLNKNSLPFDTLPWTLTSGIRIGTPAMTTRGFKEAEAQEVVALIIETLKAIDIDSQNIEDSMALKIKEKVINLCDKFPIYT